MNSHVLGALFRDALYQVLDNKVFRLLALLVAFLVLPTFLIAAREESLVLFFGWREYSYQDIFQAFDIPYPGRDVDSIQLVQTVQQLIVDQLAGTFGIVFALAATAFFMPRMLEKGAADTVFSKPVSRFALMFSRYLAGLIFVAILATVLVGGMHTGLLLNSGYSDPGFLWSIPSLIYVFALLHAFSIVVGVYTRSTVAAILLSLMFFAFSGCVHNIWKVHQTFIEVVVPMQRAHREAEESSPEKPDSAAVQAFQSGLLTTLNVLHYTLPKTTDAGVIARSLRRHVESLDSAFYDDNSRLQVLVAPEGFVQQPVQAERPKELARWALIEPDGSEAAHITIERWNFEERRRPTAVKELRKELEAAGIEDLGQDRENMAGSRADVLTWSTLEGDEARFHRSFLFDGRGFFIVSIEGRQARLDEPEIQRGLTAFLASFTFGENDEDHNPFSRFEDQARWGGPLKYNLWFSIASSVAFALVMLGLGWWRLARIDF